MKLQRILLSLAAASIMAFAGTAAAHNVGDSNDVELTINEE